jgi:hypothetical protein
LKRVRLGIHIATTKAATRLVDPYSNETVLGARYEYDLDEVEGFLRQHWE